MVQRDRVYAALVRKMCKNVIASGWPSKDILTLGKDCSRAVQADLDLFPTRRVFRSVRLFSHRPDLHLTF